MYCRVEVVVQGLKGECRGREEERFELGNKDPVLLLELAWA